MTKTRFILLSSLLGSMALVGGCRVLSGNSCLKPPSPADTRDNPPLRVPLGLDAPDTRAALKVPPLDQPAAPAMATRCLEDPPFIVPLASLPADKDAKATKGSKPEPVRPKGPRG